MAHPVFVLVLNSYLIHLTVKSTPKNTYLNDKKKKITHLYDKH